jgi:hypothetical protein
MGDRTSSEGDNGEHEEGGKSREPQVVLGAPSAEEAAVIERFRGVLREEGIVLTDRWVGGLRGQSWQARGKHRGRRVPLGGMIHF